MKRQNFDYIQLKVASPEDILEWSRGEVKKPETINYRTHRAELDGLMCEKIFGPTKDYECYCGKYKKYKYKGIVCDKCGVEVTKKSVRRERMGHIRLASPVTHVWYAHGVPNKISILLDIPQKKLQSVIYFSRYLVVESDGDGKKIAIEKVKELIKQDLDKIDEEIKTKISEEEEKSNSDIKKYKSSDKFDDLEVENLEHKTRQKVAKFKEEGLKRKNEAEAEKKILLDLVNRIDIGETLTEEEHVLLLENEISFFDLKMGAEAIKYVLEKLNLDELRDELQKDIKSTSIQKRLKATQRLRYVNAFIKNEMKPEWLVIEALPVISPELRPIVSISGGRFATADLNDLYRRVVNRNNRLKRLIELGAPDVILRNEKRMLQESVDALIDNSHRPSNAVLNKRKVPLKSLSDTLRGKQGRFRQNLLGKRVDYSGRAVIITAGRELNIDQCGIPKMMALELFKPFVIQQLIEKGIAANARSAKYLIDGREKSDEVWNILDEVITGHPVFLNRAPTFHKQSIQAFFPVLVEGFAIRIHPLVCEGFNADFDGDQMAIHVPLTEEAIKEAKELMTPNKNMLKAASGEFIMAPNRDLAQMVYYLTTLDETLEDKVVHVFKDKNEAYKAYQNGKLHLRQMSKIFILGDLRETTIGRMEFNSLLPDDYPFVNEIVDRKKLKDITLDIVERYEEEIVTKTLNKINDIGFKYSTSSGFSTGISDLVMLPDLQERIDEAVEKTQEINNFYQMGLLTEREKSEKFSKLWVGEFIPNMESSIKTFLDKENSLKAVADSGARYKYDVINQIIGVKGIVQDATQKIIELPILSNYLKGLSSFEYFISCKGGRKGLADTALRTADSGYLTRKLSDVSQDCIVNEEDCGQTKGVLVNVEDDKNRSMSYEARLVGRVPVKDVLNKKKVIVKANELISAEQAKEINDAKIKSVEVRTPLTCKSRFGICKKCYGLNYGTNEEVEIGTAVGIIAAQSVGEPASQLVLRTFHSGGKAGDDITMGLPRIQELFEARIPKGKAIIAEIGGKVEIVDSEDQNVIRIKNEIVDTIEYPFTENDKLIIKPKQKLVKGGDLLITLSSGEEIRSTRKGEVRIKDNVVYVDSNLTEEVEYKVSKDQELLIAHEDTIEAGTPITKGNIDPRQLLQATGITDAQKYIIDEIQRVYLVQGIPLGDKHLEVIVAQMGRYARVVNSGDSDIIVGEIRDKHYLEIINEGLKALGKKPVKYSTQLLGITAAALKTESFLSAASFQDQIRVLSDAAIMGKRDYLRGLKENVIVGRMIPIGQNAIIESQEEIEEDIKEEISEEVSEENVENPDKNTEELEIKE